MRWSTKIAIAFIGATIFGFTALTASKPTARQSDTSLPAPVVKPLRLTNGAVVVDLRCGEVLLLTSSRLEKFSCTLTNNTEKRIPYS
jgi:hypothetical protein